MKKGYYIISLVICLLLSGCVFSRPSAPASPTETAAETATESAAEPAASAAGTEAETNTEPAPERVEPTAEHVELPAIMILPDKASIGRSKVFTGDGFSITLTDQFTEKESELGFDAYYSAPFCGVMVLIEPFTPENGLEEESLVEYVSNVIESNGHDAHPLETEGLIYYRYERDGYAGVSYSFKGNDAFYVFQFVCRNEDMQHYASLFYFFAESVTVDYFYSEQL